MATSYLMGIILSIITSATVEDLCIERVGHAPGLAVRGSVADSTAGRDAVIEAWAK